MDIRNWLFDFNLSTNNQAEKLPKGEEMQELLTSMQNFVIGAVTSLGPFILLIALSFRKEIGAFMTKHRKLVRAVAIIVGVAIYLNIGWAIGTYYHTYIFGHESQTFWQTVWKGGYPVIINIGNNSLLSDQIVSMFTWPLLGLLSVLLWVVRFAQIGTIYFIWLVSYIFKLIFAGGIAKLLGVG